MYWQDKPTAERYVVPDDVQDLVFRVGARSLPLDHAYALSAAIRRALPWLGDEPRAGIHLIHGAESGNGWQRPEDPDSELLQLSKRARLTLRLPKQRLDDARSLTGMTLDIGGHALEVGDASTKPLSPLTTLFARYVIADPEDDEDSFVQAAVVRLRELGIEVRKLLCGRQHTFRFPGERVFVRSLMLAELEIRGSVLLQEQGLGPGRQFGCGLFIPHKGIEPVKREHDE